MKNFKLLFLMASSFLGTGCGSGVDPLALFDKSLPELNSIIANTFTPALLVGGYTSATPYWVFAQGGAFAGSYLAPAAGIVAEKGTDYMVIVHSGRMRTKITGLAIINVRPGDSVSTGSAVATFIGSSTAQFQVIVDNAAVCPLSYMSQAFRANFTNFSVFSVTPCI